MLIINFKTKHMATFKEQGDKFENKLKSVSRFKIGKTGQTIQQRYDSAYADIYEKGEVVGSSADSKTIDDFEKYMIERFMSLDNCDNEQVGGGDMVESDRYIVYVMYNE